VPRLVVGLGNPGKQYERTRHNVGWMVVDRACARRGIEPTKKAFEARYAFHGIGREQVGFVKPLTYMNLSGEAARGFADFYKVEPRDVLVVCDDLALPLGQLRIRAGGSSGGQKGLESTIRMLGTEQVPRLRIGIGAPPPFMDAADWVLAKFREDEAKVIAEAVEKAADAVDCWLAQGVEVTQARFNVRPKAEADEKKDSSGKAAKKERSADDAPRGAAADGEPR
jgi:PTH1 family peptidyl-tRNA hydrolase